MAETVLDFDDWIDLLGLRDDFTALIEGRTSPGQIRTALAVARIVFPGVMGDYIRAIEGLDAYVDAVARAIDEQNTTLEDFNLAIEGAGISFSWDETRLLSEQKKSEIDRIQSFLEELAGRAEQAAAQADDGAEELRDLLEVLEQQVAELGDQAGELMERIGQVEEQLAIAEGADE